MGLDKRRKKASADGTSSDAMKVEVIDEAVFQGASDISMVKQELSEMEDIMEGDIILKVNPGGDWQILSGSNKSKYCMEHIDMFLHQDDNLVKVGDSFKTHQDFIQYISSNANQWCFFYKCTESQNTGTEDEAYTYNCVYLKNRDYKKKTQKKRQNFKTDCPCKIKLRRKPEGLSVVFVCNHHDHELSEESFNKLQNTKKLSPYLKEVIMDLISLEVEISKIRKYVEVESGMKMSRAFFYEIERKMKINNDERHISDKRLKELSDKMSVLDEIFSCDDEDNSDDPLQFSKSKRTKSTKGDSAPKRTKYERNVSTCDSETIETVQNLEETNDSQGGKWVNDQCVPAGPSRNSTLGWEESAIANDSTVVEEDDQQDYPDTCENTYTDDYNSADYTVSETVKETEADGQPEEQYEYQTVVLQDEFGNVINCENDEQIVFLQDGTNAPADGQTIGYFDGEKIIYCDPNEANNGNEANEGHEGNKTNDGDTNACDVAVQTSSQKPGHSYVPMFDVYMKDGNVTGFVVNDKNKSGDGVEKGVQTPEDTIEHEPLHDEGNEIPNLPAPNATQEIVDGDTYTKHEYIHRYNIDRYMTNANFPKYIETLAKKTRNDVLSMLTRVYNEKAMFKMTTTQRGKEGYTKIWYLTDVRRKGKYKMSEEQKMKRDKIGQYITDILILKERVKTLTNDNSELVSRNKYLEDVALRLAKMRSN